MSKQELSLTSANPRSYNTNNDNQQLSLNVESRPDVQYPILLSDNSDEKLPISHSVNDNIRSPMHTPGRPTAISTSFPHSTSTTSIMTSKLSSAAPSPPPQGLAYDDLSHANAEIEIPDDPVSTKFSFRTLWAFTGPGWLMSIAYLDPGNLESDLQAGAYTGYRLIWVLFLSTLVGLLMQILACRLGTVTGHHLAEICRHQYAKKTRIALWLLIETAIIGSDIQEVIGSAIAFNILFGLPLWAGVLITGLDTFTFLFLHYFGVRRLEAFFAALISTMAVCFCLDAVIIGADVTNVIKGFVPTIPSYATIQAVSIIGAVIMPHNMFLHSALVHTRKIDRTRTDKVRQATFYFSVEAAVALFISFFINLAVVAVFAKGFFSIDCAESHLALVNGTCQKIGLSEAGDALTGLLGTHASTIWAIGLLAAGQSSTMTGTYSGQFVMDGFLNLQISPWKRVAITRFIALFPAVSVATFGASNKTTGDTVGEWLNVLQSIILPFALIPLIHFTSSQNIMGEFTNSLWIKLVSWPLALLVISTNFYLVIQFLTDSESPLPHTAEFFTFAAIIGLIYLTFVIYLMRHDIIHFINFIVYLYQRLVFCFSGSTTNELSRDNSPEFYSANGDEGSMTIASLSPNSDEGLLKNQDIPPLPNNNQSNNESVKEISNNKSRSNSRNHSKSTSSKNDGNSDSLNEFVVHSQNTEKV